MINAIPEYGTFSGMFCSATTCQTDKQVLSCDSKTSLKKCPSGTTGKGHLGCKAIFGNVTGYLSNCVIDSTDRKWDV
jgi:hypothetical protein